MFLCIEKCIKVKSPDNRGYNREKQQKSKLKRQPAKEKRIGKNGHQYIVNKEINNV